MIESAYIMAGQATLGGAGERYVALSTSTCALPDYLSPGFAPVLKLPDSYYEELRARQAAKPYKSVYWPRSRERQEERMTRFVNWRHRQIVKRRIHHLQMFMAWTCLPPLAGVVIAMCWRAALWFVLS